MYLILTASKDSYITNKIISDSASASTRATSAITIAGGALDVNVKITLVSADQTSKTYIGITEDHGSIANGTVLAVGMNPDAGGNIEDGDDRIGMIAFMVGANNVDAASMLQQTINHSNGHNAGASNSKIAIANNGSGKLTLTQSAAGSAGNTAITVAGDTSNRVTVDNDPDGFEGGRTAAPIRATDANVGLAGTLDLFKLYGENQIKGGETDLVELSRALIKFDHDSLIPLMSKSLDISDNSLKCFMYLRDMSTGRTTPTNMTMLAIPLSKSFDEGIGRSVSTFNDLDTTNFLTASYNNGAVSAWITEGANATGSSPGSRDAITTVQARSPFAGAPNSTPANTPTNIDLISRFEVVEGPEDVVFDVTNAMSSTLKCDIANHGFRVSLDESEENNGKTYFIKRLGSRHVRNTKFRPELHVLWNDSTRDDTQNLEFNTSNTLYLTNYSKGVGANIISGTIAGDPATTTLNALAGINCMKLILSKSSFSKSYNVSQVLRGTDSLGEPGLYSASFNVDLFSSNTLYGSIKATAELTIVNGPIDVNTKISLVSQDGTNISYIGITEGHASLVNGEILAIGANPDGAGALIAGDSRIGMRAFMVGSSATDAANMLEIAINHANGHNAGNAGSKITIANNGSGILTLTQTTAGSEGNTAISIVGDTSGRIKGKNNRLEFVGGRSSITLEEVGRISGSIELDAFWKSNDQTIIYHDQKVLISTSSTGKHGHGETRPVLSMTNLRDVYDRNDDVKIRVFAFDQNADTHAPVKVPVSRKAEYLGDLYWQLINVTTGQPLISYQFDTEATKLSFDREGYYFDFLMSTPPPGGTYRFEFARKFRGKTSIISQKRFARFRVK
jgi:hypothetical protein